MENIYLQNEAKKNFKNWTSEGWDFLLHNELYKDIAIISLSKILNKEQQVEFTYSDFYYEIFESCEGGYIVNVYTSDEKDDEDCYLDENCIDGGLCTGNSKDAIEFMMQ